MSQSCTQLICVISMVIRGGDESEEVIAVIVIVIVSIVTVMVPGVVRVIGRVIEITVVVAEMFTVGRVATILLST